jgi:antirestriction protein ArdC
MSEKIYEMVTDRIVALLENGVIPWRKTWASGTQWPSFLQSRKKQRRYNGINVLILACQGYASPFWVTYKQAKKLGGHVKKDEKSTPIIFWKWIEIIDRETGDPKNIPFIRYYRVFNVLQCDELDKHLPEEVQLNDFNPIDECQKLIDGYCNENGGPKTAVEGRAVYYPTKDVIGMPKPTAFESEEAYYSVYFHEMAHSTGHSNRLDRDMGGGFGTDPYCREELVAEISAAFLCGVTGIDNQQVIENSASYIDNWIKRLKFDPKMIVQAGGKARRAADLITGEEPWKEAS